MQEYVRALWEARLKCERGSLPAEGDAESNMLRMRLTTDIKRMRQVRWNTVKEIIRDYRQHKEN